MAATNWCHTCQHRPQCFPGYCHEPWETPTGWHRYKVEETCDGIPLLGGKVVYQCPKFKPEEKTEPFEPPVKFENTCRLSWIWPATAAVAFALIACLFWIK